MKRWTTAMLAIFVVSCSDDPDAQQASSAAPGTGVPTAPGAGYRLSRGKPPPAAWAHKPRIGPAEDSGLRALPDGELKEWDGRKWVAFSPVARKAAGFQGAADLGGKLALAPYGNGVSLALDVTDDHHLPAKAEGALGSADHVELELVPLGPRPVEGIRLSLGTLRQLVRVDRPRQRWRQEAVTSSGIASSSGYRLEVRVPLYAMTPLPAPVIRRLRYRVVLYDVDGDGEAPEPTLEASGELKLSPAMTVPAAVRERPSVRVCMASQADALWGYEHGWRCAAPHRREIVRPDDTATEPAPHFGFARVPTPPRIVWIRERVLFVNLTEVDRGVAALLDRKDTILSLLPLGVVSAEDPGNPRSRDSGAEVIKLPDGSYALAVTHAHPAEPGPLGGRCAAGHRVYLSIIALRGCYRSTPTEPAPEPKFTPYLEEVLRVVLEDCERTISRDWSISRDRKTVRIHSSVQPAKAPTTWRYKDGRYRLPEAPVRQKPVPRESAP